MRRDDVRILVNLFGAFLCALFGAGCGALILWGFVAACIRASQALHVPMVR